MKKSLRKLDLVISGGVTPCSQSALSKARVPLRSFWGPTYETTMEQGLGRAS